MVAPQTHQSPPPLPRSGVYLGAYSLHGPAFQRNYIGSFKQLEETACRSLDIAHVYIPWGHSFPTSSALALARTGHYLLISMRGTDMPDMASGRDDAGIIATARQIARVHYPIFIEFRWEMDRPNLSQVVVSPAAYIAAWDRTRRLFAAVGVHNAAWVWCPTAAGFESGRAQLYYPGDREVDWVCADAYPYPARPGSAPEPLGELLAPFVTWAKQEGKPAMIGEFGVSQAYSADQRARWLLDAEPTLSTPPIMAAVYFDTNVTSSPGRSYEIGTTSAVASAFRRLALDRRFRPVAPADPGATG